MVKHKGIRVGNRKRATRPPERGGINYQFFSTLALVLPFISTTSLVFFMEHFSQSPDVRQFAVRASCVVVIVAMSAFFALSGLQLLHPKPMFTSYSLLRKGITLALYSISIFFTCWPVLSTTGPMLYTALWGERTTKLVVAEKQTRDEIKKCRLYLAPVIKRERFKECLDQEEFNRLPSGPVLAEINATVSSLGYIVHDFNGYIGTVEGMPQPSLYESADDL